MSQQDMGNGVWTRLGRGRCSCDMQTATIFSRRYALYMYNVSFTVLLQVSIPMLILPLASLDELFTSVLFDVLEVNRESLIVLLTTILMNKGSFLLDICQLLG